MDQRGSGNGQTVVTGISQIGEHSMVKNNQATRSGRIALGMLEKSGSGPMTFAIEREDSYAASNLVLVRTTNLSVYFKISLNKFRKHFIN